MSLQVLDPLGLVYEQEISGPEELEATQPANNTAIVITSQTDLNSSPHPSDSSLLAITDVPLAASHTGSEAVSVPLSAVASPSFSDAESALPPPPLMDCTSASEPCSAPPLTNSPSNSLLGTPSVADDASAPPQTRSDPHDSHLLVDRIAAPFFEIPSDQSNCAHIENHPLKIVTSRSSSQKQKGCSLQAPNSPSDTHV